MKSIFKPPDRAKRPPGSSEGRLSRLVVKAAFWATGIRVGMRSFTLIRTILLARLLAPGDFGLMGIALIMLSFMEKFTHTGFRPALIQRQGDIGPYLDTAWTIEVFRGLVTGLVLVLAAPLIAGFFDAPEAVMIIRVTAAAVVFRGFINVGIVYFQRDLEMDKRFKYEMTGLSVDVGVSIVMAFLLQSVWALVYGTLAGSFALVVASYVLNGYRPKPRLEWAKARELYAFGKWILGFSALEFLRENLDQVLVGRLLGPASLGLYQIAFRLSQLIGRELTQVAIQVVFPTLARLQNERERLQKAYIEAAQLVALVAFPMAAGLIGLAPRLVPAIMGESWEPMVPALQVLGVAGLMRSLNGSADVLFQAIGRPALTTKLDLATLLVLLALIYPMIVRWDLFGAALSVLLSTAVVFPVRVWFSSRLLGIGFKPYLKILSVPLVGSLLLVVVMRWAEASMQSQPSVLQVISLAAVGAITYLAATFVIDNFSGRSIRRTLMHRLRPG